MWRQTFWNSQKIPQLSPFILLHQEFVLMPTKSYQILTMKIILRTWQCSESKESFPNFNPSFDGTLKTFDRHSLTLISFDRCRLKKLFICKKVSLKNLFVALLESESENLKKIKINWHNLVLYDWYWNWVLKKIWKKLNYFF